MKTSENPSLEQAIDKLVEQTLKEWDIPGLALAIVHKGKRIKVRGYGVKERGKTDIVNADTLFQIASLTKAFTALTTSLLVKEGKLKWDQPIRNYLPNFRLKDPTATQKMTIADLLSNRTGLSEYYRQEWRLWWHTGRSADELIERLAFIDPAFPFRSRFSSSSMAFIIASKVIAHAAGMPWKKICEEKIFKVLGMKRTSLSFASLSEDTNSAFAHLLPHFYKEPIPWMNCEFGEAAGGINSCANDMVLWLEYCLSHADVFTVTQQPRVRIEAEGLFDRFSAPIWPIFTHNQDIVDYGYAWMMYKLANRQVYFHMGLTDGMQSMLATLPEEQLGIVILTNESPHLGHACLLNNLIDRFLKLDEIDWHKKAHEIQGQIEKNTQQIKEHLQANRKKGSAPSLPLIEYAGEYIHPAYGSLFIEMKDKKLQIELFSHEKGMLEHWQNNQFEIIHVSSAPPIPWIIDFQLSQDLSKIISLIMPDLGTFIRK